MGSASLVLKDLYPRCVSFGVPAKYHRNREKLTLLKYEEEIRALAATQPLARDKSLRHSLRAIPSRGAGDRTKRRSGSVFRPLLVSKTTRFSSSKGCKPSRHRRQIRCGPRRYTVSCPLIWVQACVTTFVTGMRESASRTISCTLRTYLSGSPAVRSA